MTEAVYSLASYIEVGKNTYEPNFASKAEALGQLFGELNHPIDAQDF